jgi:UDP-glucose 4-epimerase
VPKVCVTGGAGFIGSNLADRLAAEGTDVVVLDDFRTGRREFVANLLARPNASLVEGDVLDDDALDAALPGCDTVVHLQANADVRRGLDHPSRDLEQNTVATSKVLEAMRRHGIERIAFSSTGSIYGEPTVFPTPEDCPFPVQTSLYGASKLACEGLIAAYCSGFGFTGLAFRFVSIMGERYTHGHLIDFYRALKNDGRKLRILGDGRQEKSYLYVQDCVGAMLTALQVHNRPGFEVYNLGTDETLVVDDSVAQVSAHLGVTPELEHTGGTRGWTGDSPLILLDCTKMRSLGWAPRVNIRDAMTRTLEWFDAHPWIVMEHTER